MNYKKHYNNLIIRAQNRQVNGYSERHHIIPKCLGGSNSKKNLVRLLPEEHRIAHLLLVKIYPNENKLLYAANMMVNRTKMSNKGYKHLRERFAKMHSRNMSGENNPFFGKRHTLEAKKKIGIANAGENNANFGKKLPEETRKKISENNFARRNPEKQKKHASRAGKFERTAEHRKKVSISNSGSNGPNAKTYEAISPTGEVHNITGELKQFCLDRKMNYRLLLAFADRDKPTSSFSKTEETKNTIGWFIRRL